MASIETITIGAVSYSVYGLGNADPVQDADDYLAAKLGSTWSTATTLQKQQAIVTAARMLDRAVKWSGSKTVSTQVLAWPRDGANNGCTGEAVTNATTPDEIAYAQFLLADRLFLDATLADNLGTGSNIKRVKAGSAEVEYFSPTIDTNTDTRLPVAVNDIAKCFFASTGTFGGSWGTATTDAETYDSCDDDRNQGYA